MPTLFRKSLPLLVLCLTCTAVAQQRFIQNWQARATATQSAQPHWVTPLATVTPRLTVLMMKYRLFARNEQHGNSIVTAFFGGTIPTGSYSNGSTDASVSPTLAVGKGFGLFDFQSTAGVTLPVADSDKLGRPLAWNRHECRSEG